jgi:hypothetical protein
MQGAVEILGTYGISAMHDRRGMHRIPVTPVTLGMFAKLAMCGTSATDAATARFAIPGRFARHATPEKHENHVQLEIAGKRATHRSLRK